MGQPPSTPLDRRHEEISLDIDAETMRRAGYQVVDWIVERLATLRERPLGKEISRDEAERLLHGPMPEEPTDFHLVLAEFAQKVAPNAIALDHPRFFAFIPSAPTYASIFADALAAGANVFAGTWLEAAGPAQVEITVLDWLRQMIGLPDTAFGVLVSGGSVANLTALAVARHARLEDQTAGATVYLSDQVHSSLDRALRLLGFPQTQWRRIASDDALRMDSRALAAQVESDRREGLRPFAVLASAGTTNTGAVDPLPEIAGVARRFGLWFHVDAAYGGFAALTERGKEQLAGIELADSVVLDPHKWFYCPFEAGCVLVRDGRLLPETFRILPDYMRDVEREQHEVNFCDYGVQLTRAFRALKVWMNFKVFGARRLRQVIDQCLDLAREGAGLFAASPRIEMVTPPSLGIFSFRYVPRHLPADAVEREKLLEGFNVRLVSRITRSGRVFLSSTRLRSRTVIRLCILNHRTRREDLQEALEAVERIGAEMETEIR
jgi:glutamate/tyrosine decarboxylase-like PLP-dependent enzyme